MVKVKERGDYFLSKGDVISLQVGYDSNGYANFTPFFLNKDRWAPGRSMRIFRPSKGIKKPELTVGEEWTAKVVGCKLDRGTTHDARSRVIVFLDDFQRVEHEIKRIINDQYGQREIWSGICKVAVLPAVKLHVMKDEYKNGDQVVVVQKYYEINNGLFATTTATYALCDYQQKLREAGIDVARYFKKMRRWRRQASPASAA